MKSRSILSDYVGKINSCSSKNELKTLLTQVRRILKNNRSFSFFISKNKLVSDKISEIYLYNNSIKESVYRLINEIDTDILCGCGNKCSFLDNNRGYNEFCGDRRCIFMNSKKKDSMTKSFMSKYGQHPMKCEHVKNNLKISMVKKYGFDNIMKYYSENNLVNSKIGEESVKNKIKQTFLLKYGSHPMQCEQTFENNLRSRTNFKSYTLPSGKIIKLQGYENYGIEFLLKKYEESDILSSVSEINKEIGIINYLYLDSLRKYYPDFFIKSVKKIYEVKSIWTYKSNIEKNKLKKEACESMGIRFEFLIFDYRGNLINI